MNAALLFEKVMDHLQQLLAELDELVRRVRHDKKLSKILQVGFDFLDLCAHPKPATLLCLEVEVNARNAQLTNFLLLHYIGPNWKQGTYPFHRIFPPQSPLQGDEAV